jgi:hypothetical protein
MCALIVFSMATGAQAQTPVIVSGPPQAIRLLPNQDLTQALQLVGCDPGWLSALVTENNIPVKQLGNLPFGGVYSLPTGVDCRKPAPPEVAALTKSLAATRAATARAASLQQTIAGLESQIAELKGQLENAAAGMQRAESDGRACAAAKGEIESRLQTVTQERDNVRAELAARWSAWAGLLAGIALSTVVCLGWWLIRRRSA